MTRMPDAEVLCVGELLWDSLPAGLFLGGAPYNVAGHLHALGAPVAMVSRVGHDRLGAEALRRVAHAGVATDLVQTDPTLPTGFVSVTLDAAGVPAYDIVAPAAWDRIALDDAVLARAAAATAIVFGSLAQRGAVSRATIERLGEVDVPKVFDVNLRPPYEDAGVVRRSLAHAEVVKLNEHELRRMAAWFALPEDPRDAVTALAERFGCRTICVTRGDAGAAMLHAGRWTEHPGYRVEACDTVGSGDAFLAAFLWRLLRGDDDEAILQHANLLGAYVATQSGAIPAYDQEALDLILAANQHAAVPPPSLTDVVIPARAGIPTMPGSPGRSRLAPG
jgi:fructokinase